MGKINKRRADGITLIALIITIIILLILAGVSIAALSERGIFANANKAKLETKRAQVEEWLKLKVMEEQVNNPNGTSQEIIPKVRENVENNQDELKKIGKNVAVEALPISDNLCKMFYVITPLATLYYYHISFGNSILYQFFCIFKYYFNIISKY